MSLELDSIHIIRRELISFNKTMNSVTSWWKLLQKYTNSTSNCFPTQRILQIWHHGQKIWSNEEVIVEIKAINKSFYKNLWIWLRSLTIIISLLNKIILINKVWFCQRGIVSMAILRTFQTFPIATFVENQLISSAKGINSMMKSGNV